MLLHDLLTAKPCDFFLEGRRVLVVEDDYVQATDLCEHLLFCGAEVMGPVACEDDASPLWRPSLPRTWRFATSDWETRRSTPWPMPCEP